MSGIDDVKRSFADWCAVAADRTAEAAKVTSRRYDKFALGRDIDRKLSELGAIVHQGLRTGRDDVLADPRIGRLSAEVAELEQERAAKDEEIAGIRHEHAERRQSNQGWDGPDAGEPGDPNRGGGGENGDRRPEFSD